MNNTKFFNIFLLIYALVAMLFIAKPFTHKKYAYIKTQDKVVEYPKIQDRDYPTIHIFKDKKTKLLRNIYNGVLTLNLNKKQKYHSSFSYFCSVNTIYPFKTTALYTFTAESSSKFTICSYDELGRIKAYSWKYIAITCVGH